jgi:hypothetical protein
MKTPADSVTQPQAWLRKQWFSIMTVNEVRVKIGADLRWLHGHVVTSQTCMQQHTRTVSPTGVMTGLCPVPRDLAIWAASKLEQKPEAILLLRRSCRSVPNRADGDAVLAATGHRGNCHATAWVAEMEIREVTLNILRCGFTVCVCPKMYLCRSILKFGLRLV